MEGYISDPAYLGGIISNIPKTKKDRQVQAKSSDYTSIGLSLASLAGKSPELPHCFAAKVVDWDSLADRGVILLQLENIIAK